MVEWFRFRSVRRGLAIYFLAAALIPLFCATGIISFQRVASIKKEAYTKLEAIRDLKMETLDSWLDERVGDMGVIAGDLEVRALGAVFEKENLSNEDRNTVKAARGLISRYLENYRDYHEVFIVSADSGTVELSTDASNEGKDRSREAYFTEALRTRKLYPMDIHYSSELKGPSMSFSVPIWGLSDKSRITGILVARIDLERSLYDLLLHRTGMGETGETLIVNEEVFALSELRWYEQAPLKLRIDAKPAVLAAQGKTGVVETADYRGVQVLAAYGHIPRMKWGFVAKQDISETYAPIRAMYRNIALLVVIFAVATYFFAVILSRILSEPLVEMATVSRKLQKGILSARNRVEREDEIGFLAQAINAMADSMVAQIYVQQNSTEINNSMVESNDLRTASQSLVEKLLDVTDSDLCIFYMRGDDGKTFEHMASVGANRDLLKPFDGAILEGGLGKALASKKIFRTTDIPEDTHFIFRTAAGASVPKEIVAIPLVVDKEVRAVVSLASVKPYSGDCIDALERAWPGMNTAMANLLANQKTRALANELKVRNQELEAQASELRAQASELETQRIQVQEADRLKSEFLSNMSHELRTPLNSVIALSELMSSRGSGRNEEKDAKYLKIMKKNSYHLLNLINDILDLSKIEAGRMELYLTDFGPRKPLERAIETTHSLAAQKGLELQAQISDVPAMNSDEDKVYQILLNLISNAVKFTESGHINVGLRGEDGKVFYSVKDTGIGIAASDLAHIFDEFRQVDGSTTRKHEGTGLGLTICQRLAILLGGEIAVESVKGEGSTFLLSLPSSCPEFPKKHLALPQPAPARPGRTAPGGPSAWKKTVLVVDDEAEIREMIRGHLVGAGYDVVVASGGAEALMLAEELHPFAITLDVLMPDMDGWEVLRTLKESESTANIPVIIVSVGKDMDTGMALGATSYLVKPVSKESLLLELEKLSRRRAIRNILVVDDDPVVREYLSKLLEEEDYRVVTVSGGGEALDTISAYLPDAVVLDLMMPDVDGFTVLDRLKTAPATHDLPVIILTAKDLTPEERIRLTEATERVITKSAMDKSHLLKELEVSLAQLEHKAAEKGTQDKPRILVVEDNDVAALQIRTALEDNGYEVIVATGGAEALATFSQVLPDAVVLDLMMPEIDGFQVLDQIRSTPWTATLPVLVLTAKELTAVDRAQLKHNNVQEMIQKGSMNRDELVAHVGRLVNRAPIGEQLPAVKKEEEVDAVSDSDEPSVRQVSTCEKTILIIEDNPDSMFTITEILDEMGIAYIEAVDGAEGVQIAKDAKPDLIIMDIQLPGLSGLDATKQIREIEEISKTPIIAMTAKAMKGDKEKVLAAGCDAYVSKPLVAGEVVALIRRWIDQ